MTVEGLGFEDVKSPYDRLPARAEGVVPPAVWSLSRDSSGALVRFTAATKEIRARWTVTNRNRAAANITAIASSGLYLSPGPMPASGAGLASGNRSFLTPPQY